MADTPHEHGGNIVAMAHKYGLSAQDITDFSANINPLGMPERLQAAIVSQLSLAERYPDVEYRRLHEALARAHGCQPEQIMAGNGATELIYALVEYLRPRRALLLTPGFAEYRRALVRAECEIDTVALDESTGFQPDERLLDALDARPDCVFIATPNNPTGLMPNADLLAEVVSRCRRGNIALIVDEAFIDFIADDPGLIPQMDRIPRLYILRSLTKFFAIPGLRLGYLASADTQGIRLMKSWREPWTINAFAALAGEILQDDQDYIARTHRWIARARPSLYQGLCALPALRVWPGQANYLFFRCLRPGLDLQQALLRQGLLIRHCANYPGLGPDYYRVAVKSEADNHRLVAALGAVLADG